MLDEEQDILKHITMKTALKSVKELARVRPRHAAQPGQRPSASAARLSFGVAAA